MGHKRHVVGAWMGWGQGADAVWSERATVWSSTGAMGQGDAVWSGHGCGTVGAPWGRSAGAVWSKRGIGAGTRYHVVEVEHRYNSYRRRSGGS
ncbi:hypothetical protein R1flu_002010 [Riccia fluitans]|uniref:Uncharacterized protein n=1 Tax=Riccia fluitans TaxID=41844 RepID=A0ABD1Y530_9MARC